MLGTGLHPRNSKMVGDMNNAAIRVEITIG